MKVHQLSLFVENRPGQLRAPCKALADAGVNILTLSLADTEQFGILRIIVREWEKAKEVLEASDFVVNVTEMVAVAVPDHPGGLADVLEAMEGTGVNVEYMYAFTTRRGDQAVLLFRFDDPDSAIEQLGKTAVSMLESDELYRLFE